MLFRVISGTYRRGTEVYRKGDMVKSDQELDKKFIGIFERIHKEGATEQPKPKRVIKEVNLDEMEAQERSQEKVRRSTDLEEEERKANPKTDHIVPELVETEDGKWNIVNSVTGKNINDFPLSKPEAVQIKALFEGKDITAKEPPKRRPAPMKRRLPRGRKKTLKKRPKRTIKLVDV